jgi:hypothetical protein
LVKRAEQQQHGFTSAHALADVAHRLMTIEAINLLGWPLAGVAARLRKHHVEIPNLLIYRQAIARFPLLGIQVLPITQPLVEVATLLSQQHEFLTGDAVMASNDADVDRVPGITRYAPA